MVCAAWGEPLSKYFANSKDSCALTNPTNPGSWILVDSTLKNQLIQIICGINATHEVSVQPIAYVPCTLEIAAASNVTGRLYNVLTRFRPGKSPRS